MSRLTAPAPSATPTELKMLLWTVVLISAWCAIVFGLQAMNADKAAASAITPEVARAHAVADGWDL